MDKSVPIPDKYLRACRKWIDKMNTGVMTVYEFEPVVEEDSGITDFELTPVLTDIPCRLSYQDKQAATKDEPAQADKRVRVITAVDVDVKEGAVLEITYDGETHKYKQAGKTHINDFRKSIPLEAYEEHTVIDVYEGGSEWE